MHYITLRYITLYHLIIYYITSYCIILYDSRLRYVIICATLPCPRFRICFRKWPMRAKCRFHGRGRPRPVWKRAELARGCARSTRGRARILRLWSEPSLPIAILSKSGRARWNLARVFGIYVRACVFFLRACGNPARGRAKLVCDFAKSRAFARESSFGGARNWCAGARHSRVGVRKYCVV